MLKTKTQKYVVKKTVQHFFFPGTVPYGRRGQSNHISRLGKPYIAT